MKEREREAVIDYAKSSRIKKYQELWTGDSFRKGSSDLDAGTVPTFVRESEENTDIR